MSTDQTFDRDYFTPLGKQETRAAGSTPAIGVCWTDWTPVRVRVPGLRALLDQARCLPAVNRWQ